MDLTSIACFQWDSSADSTLQKGFLGSSFGIGNFMELSIACTDS